MHKKTLRFITERKKGEKGEKQNNLFSYKLNNTYSFSPYYFNPSSLKFYIISEEFLLIFKLSRSNRTLHLMEKKKGEKGEK